MANLNTIVSEFLRDAQYRIGELSVEINKLDKEGSYLVEEKRKQRTQLSVWMSVLYEGRWYISDGNYNHLRMTEIAGLEDSWTEYEIISEIEYLRYYTNMNEVPFINFTAHYPQIASSLGSGRSVGSGNTLSFPAGLPGQVVLYDTQSIPYAESLDNYGGMYDTETIDAYFTNRL